VDLHRRLGRGTGVASVARGLPEHLAVGQHQRQGLDVGLRSHALLEQRLDTHQAAQGDAGFDGMG